MEGVLLYHDFIQRSDLIHTKLVIALITLELLSSRVARDYLKLTFCFTFWTFTVYRFSWHGQY
jgi:hypothetical protein